MFTRLALTSALLLGLAPATAQAAALDLPPQPSVLFQPIAEIDFKWGIWIGGSSYDDDDDDGHKWKHRARKHKHKHYHHHHYHHHDDDDDDGWRRRRRWGDDDDDD